MGKHDDEDGAELAARALLEREFGCPLIRIAPAAVPTVDYRTAEPARGVEVKQITSEAYRDLSAAARRGLHWDSTILTGRWSVLIERPTLSDVLAPTRLGSSWRTIGSPSTSPSPSRRGSWIESTEARISAGGCAV